MSSFNSNFIGRSEERQNLSNYNHDKPMQADDFGRRISNYNHCNSEEFHAFQSNYNPKRNFYRSPSTVKPKATDHVTTQVSIAAKVEVVKENLVTEASVSPEQTRLAAFESLASQYKRKRTYGEYAAVAVAAVRRMQGDLTLAALVEALRPAFRKYNAGIVSQTRVLIVAQELDKAAQKLGAPALA